MIQIITKETYEYKSKFKNKETILSDFKTYKTFDLYDINIIDLSSDSLWYSNSAEGAYLNDRSDIATIKNSINTCESKILLLFPLNCYFYYNFLTYSHKFLKSEQLKSIKGKFKQFLSSYIYEPLPEFDYEKGITKIDGETFESDFYFKENTGLIYSEKSKKVNTILLKNGLVASTLNIFELSENEDTEKRLFILLNKIGFLLKNEEIPEWVQEIQFYNDNIYTNKIEKCNEKISELTKEIEKNNQYLKINDQYKSILYSSGNTLAEQINKMLIKIFNLTEDFKDIYEEDFNFKVDDITYVVETKGLNNEVSGQNVSDAYNHLIIYDDKLEQQGIIEKTKCLFFVASERKRKIEERQKIKERQITIAKRNKTLIIDTPTFYKMFEDFLQGKLSAKDIHMMFKDQDGLIMYK